MIKASSEKHWVEISKHTVLGCERQTKLDWIKVSKKGNNARN